MPVSITLTHSLSSTDTGKTKIIFHAEGARVTSKVFACEVLPASFTSAETFRFSHVCSPLELVEFPEDLPGTSCYFRVSDVSFIFDTAEMAYKVLEHMQTDVAHLVTELNHLEALGETYGTGTAIDTAAILAAATEIQFSADSVSWHTQQTAADCYLRFRNSAVKGDWSTVVAVPFMPRRTSVADTASTYTIASMKPGYDYHLGTLTRLTISSVEVSDIDSTVWFTAGSGISVVLPSNIGVIGSQQYTAGNKYVLVFRNGTVEIKQISNQ